MSLLRNYCRTQEIGGAAQRSEPSSPIGSTPGAEKLEISFVKSETAEEGGDYVQIEWRIINHCVSKRTEAVQNLGSKVRVRIHVSNRCADKGSGENYALQKGIHKESVQKERVSRNQG